jgi:hypothetical protein
VIWVSSIIGSETAAVESETTQIPLGISELGVAAFTRDAQADLIFAPSYRIQIVLGCGGP